MISPVGEFFLPSTIQRILPGQGARVDQRDHNLAADKLQKEFTDGATVGHFEKKLRSIESNYERAKAHAKKTGNKMFQKDMFSLEK